MSAQLIGAYASAAVAIITALGAIIGQIQHMRSVSAHGIEGSAKSDNTQIR